MDRTTEQLASYACDLSYQELGQEVVHQVERTLLDTLGCAVGGYPSEPAKAARELAGTISSTTPSRILGTPDYTSPDMAGFVNGVMLRYLDCNDSYFSPGGGHPSDMIPAVLALASPLGADGRTVITAITLAYEVFCRLSDQVVASDHGWDQGIFSVIGAACGAGKVLGLDREKMAHAISLAVTPNLPLGVTRTGELSMWKGCATASATRAAVFAAQLASTGMTGPYEPFEGRRGLWEQALGEQVELPPLGGNGESFRITDTTFKSYPSQIHTQGPIELALELRPKVDLAQIEAVRVQAYRVATSTAATEPEKWEPKTRETADHSIPYLVAIALLDGSVTAASFNQHRLQDPAVAALIKKMTIEERSAFTQKYPQEYNCHLEIIDKEGMAHASHTRHPRGNRLNPLTDAQVEEKFRTLAEGLLSDQQLERTAKIVWSLDGQPTLNDLFDSLIV